MVLSIKKKYMQTIEDAVTSTDAAPKAQTKARRAKSSNIVVVLDPGLWWERLRCYTRFCV